MSERTALYRLFDADEVLLYVGISKRFGQRWEQHARMQPWWPAVTSQTVRWYPSRGDAEQAEKVAIHDERPIHNRRDSPWMARPRDDGTGFEVTLRELSSRTGSTPVRNLRVVDEIWRPALAKARAEGRTLTEVITTYLRRYISTPPKGH